MSGLHVILVSGDEMGELHHQSNTDIIRGTLIVLTWSRNFGASTDRMDTPDLGSDFYKAGFYIVVRGDKLGTL
jgi:hypothetical protein